MSRQIFKQLIPPPILFDLFEKICLKTDKYYLVNHNAFKKFMYNDGYKEFVETIVGYYHESKKFYVLRDMDYNSFINIVRQICKSNQLMFTSNVKYMESRYCIEYLVYFPAC